MSSSDPPSIPTSAAPAATDDARVAAVRAASVDLLMREQAERARVADVLHDAVSQSLTAARLKVAVMRETEPRLQRDLDLVARCLDEALTATREVMSELSPPLRDLGIAACLRWLASDLERRDRVIVEVVVASEVDDEQRLDERLAPALLRALRELVRRAAARADAGRAIEIEVTRDDDEPVVRVVDSGDVPELDALREQLAWLDVRWVIESSPDGRRHVSLHLPPRA